MTGHPVGIVFHLKVRTGTLKRHYFPLQLLLTVHLLFAGNSITDSLLGYTIILPDHWAMDSGDALHPRFSDTTGTYSGMVAIERYDFSTETLYTQADEWTRANFIAYSFVVDADPVSTMLFYDTVTSRQEETPWSTEAYSVFYDPESSSTDYGEYVRFTARETSGYEIYAIGPLDEMNEHIGMYAAIVQGVTLQSAGSGVIITPVAFRKRGLSIRSVTGSGSVPRFDLLGRCDPLRDHRHAAHVVAGPGSRFCLFRFR